MKLINGSCNNRIIEDSGTVLVKMGIASDWDGNRPKIGARTGYAIYEPTECRTKAFFLHNVWDGIVGGVEE